MCRPRHLFRHSGRSVACKAATFLAEENPHRPQTTGDLVSTRLDPHTEKLLKPAKARKAQDFALWIRSQRDLIHEKPTESPHTSDTGWRNLHTTQRAFATRVCRAHGLKSGSFSCLVWFEIVIPRFSTRSYSGHYLIEKCVFLANMTVYVNNNFETSKKLR